MGVSSRAAERSPPLLGRKLELTLSSPLKEQRELVAIAGQVSLREQAQASFLRGFRDVAEEPAGFVHRLHAWDFEGKNDQARLLQEPRQADHVLDRFFWWPIQIG